MEYMQISVPDSSEEKVLKAYRLDLEPREQQLRFHHRVWGKHGFSEKRVKHQQ